MPRWLLVALLTLAVVGVAGAFTWRFLTAREEIPETSSWAFDLAEVRALAASRPGPRPRELRSELVAEAELPRAGVFAGESFEPHTMVHQVFQIVLDDRFLLIDAGMSRAFHRESMRGGRYDAGAWARVEAALAGADEVWVTHEHGDHLEGVVAYAGDVPLAPRLRLLEEQLANDRQLGSIAFPDALREAVRPVAYERMLALAPGVVAIRAAGHTPGSQVFYVALADGRELLLIGDVAWHLDAIRSLHYRPRLVTDLFLGEDRAAVMGQYRTLHGLLAAEPGLWIVPSHDGELRERLLAEGVVTAGFAPGP